MFKKIKTYLGPKPHVENASRVTMIGEWVVTSHPSHPCSGRIDPPRRCRAAAPWASPPRPSPRFGAWHTGQAKGTPDAAWDALHRVLNVCEWSGHMETKSPFSMVCVVFYPTLSLGRQWDVNRNKLA